MNNRIALVTGGAQRVGEAIVRHLAAAGWSVWIHYNRSEKQAIALVSELQRMYPDRFFDGVKADLSQHAEVLELFPQLEDKGQIPNLLVNNASVFTRGTIRNTDEALWTDQLDVNLKAPFFLMRDFEKFCKDRGIIINLVDTRITRNEPDFSAYTLSKKALWELTKMAAMEWSPRIRVNAVAPGATLHPADEDEEYLRKVAACTPMKEPGGLLPVLQSIDFILQNEYLTGQLLFADGGENLGKK